MAGDLQTLKEKGVFRRSWKFRELQVRDPKKSRNLITVLCCFADGLILGVLCGFGLGLRATGTLPLPDLAAQVAGTLPLPVGGGWVERHC